MGTNKRKKKVETESESESDSESSSSQSSSCSEEKKKRTKKSKRVSSSETDSEEEKSKEKKRKHYQLSNESLDQDAHRRTHRRADVSEQNPVTDKHNDRSYQHHYKYSKSKDSEGNSKHVGRERSRSKNRDQYKSHDRDRYDSRHRDKNDERERKDYNSSRYEERQKRDDRYSSDTRGRNKDHRKYSNDYNQRRSRSKDRDDNKSRFKDNREKREERYNRNRRSKSFDHVNAKWGKDEDENKKSSRKEPQQREKPNFGLSGKLTEETNTYRGVVIKYSEPPEARKPRRRWRLYPFKGEKALQTLYIHRQSAYLIGRDRKIADLPVDHPSCSKQHAVLQYRLVPFTRDDGTAGKRVRPYIIDLESANGTFINNKKMEAKKYIELLERDVIKFGFSSREYVLLHENSKDEALDDDVKQEDEEVTVKTEN